MRRKPSSQFSVDLLFQHRAKIAFNLLLLFPFVHLEVDIAFNLTVFVKGDTAVQPGVGFCGVPNLQLRFVALLVDKNATALVQLSPLSFRPFNIRDWVTSNFGDKCGRGF